jgi:ABC-type polysaccharide/polyol phosphate transport system ATPase subunit
MTPELTLNKVRVEYPVFSSGRHQSVLTAAAGLMSFGKIRHSSNGLTFIRAINGVSLQLKEGARVGLIGRNGSGKSTLLKVMAGVHWPTSGGRRVVGRIGSVLTSLAGLDGEKTGRENVNLICKILGIPTAQIKAISNDVEDFTELGEFYDLPVRTYSAGMGVRLNFALATSLPGEILLIDEILSAGDALFLEKAAARLRSLAGRASISVLATHAYADLANFCDLAIHLEAGRIINVGPPEQVWNEYAHKLEMSDPASPSPAVVWPRPKGDANPKPELEADRNRIGTLANG